MAVRGEVSKRLPGTENPRLPTGEIELRATEVEILSEAKTPPFYINEPDAPVDEALRLKYRYLDIRRQPMARPAPPALAHGPGDPRGPPRERLRRGRDADAHQEHAGGRPRLHRAVPAPARDRLRAPAEPAAAQAAPDGRRDGSLLPDRPLLPRRGPARRPPARVHPARPGDELRRRGDRHGLRRVDGDRGLAGHPARPPHPADPVPGLHLRRGHRAVRLGQAGHPVRDGACRPRVRPGRPRRDAVVGVRRLRRRPVVGRPGQGDRGTRHGRDHPARDRRAHRAGEAVRRQGPGPSRARTGRRGEEPDREVPGRRDAARHHRPDRGRGGRPASSSWPTRPR